MDDDHALPNDLAECQQQLLAAIQRAEELSRVLDATATSHQELQAAHQAAVDELNALKRWIYGRRTEKLVEGEGQRHLFVLESSCTSSLLLGPMPESQRSLTARRRRRELDLDKLPHFRHEHDLSEADQQCSLCGRAKDRIGQDESRILEYVPAKLEVHVHVRPKYACRYCKDGVASPPPPERPIARGIAGPGLIAQILVAKFGDHLPLYRQEDFFARHGLHIARSTQCDWVQAAAELLRPLYERQKELLLQSPVLWTDDTPVTLLTGGQEGSRQGRFWAYIAEEYPYSVYDFTESRARDGPANFLQRFKGYLHADAYGGYDHIFLGSNDSIREVACWRMRGASSSRPFTVRPAIPTSSWNGSDNYTTSRIERALGPRQHAPRFDSKRRSLCSIGSKPIWPSWNAVRFPKAFSPRPCRTLRISGRRSVVTRQMVDYRLTITSANERCVTRRSEEKTGCSSAASKPDPARPSCSRSSPAPSDIVSSRGPTCVSCCFASTTTTRVSTRCCPIAGQLNTPKLCSRTGSKSPAAKRPQ